MRSVAQRDNLRLPHRPPRSWGANCHPPRGGLRSARAHGRVPRVLRTARALSQGVRDIELSLNSHSCSMVGNRVHPQSSPKVFTTVTYPTLASEKRAKCKPHREEQTGHQTASCVCGTRKALCETARNSIRSDPLSPTALVKKKNGSDEPLSCRTRANAKRECQPRSGAETLTPSDGSQHSQRQCRSRPRAHSRGRSRSRSRSSGRSRRWFRSSRWRAAA